jgi:hypothetical protein
MPLDLLDVGDRGVEVVSGQQGVFPRPDVQDLG